jgi:hypothetical protein
MLRVAAFFSRGAAMGASFLCRVWLFLVRFLGVLLLGIGPRRRIRRGQRERGYGEETGQRP